MNSLHKERCCSFESPLRALRRISVALLLSGTVTRAAAQQVYSVNMVGYTARSIPLVQPITFAYIANPMNTVDNRLSTVLRNVPNGTMVYTYRANAFEAYTYYNGWLPNDTTLNPGEGVIMALDRSTAPDPTVLAFVGEPAFGVLMNPIPPGFSLKASIAVRSGLITRDLGLNPRDVDTLILLNENSQTDDSYFFDSFESLWLPAEPSARVAQSFWYFNASGTGNNWIQSIVPPAPAASVPPSGAQFASKVSSSESTPCAAGPVLLDIVRGTYPEVRISWPFEFSTYQLEHTAALTGGWTFATASPETVNDRRQVMLVSSSEPAFYRLKSELPATPVLYSKTCSASTMTLFWHRSYTGFHVQQRDSLTSGLWTPLGQTEIDTNGFWQVSVSPGGSLQFYRLAKN